MSPVDAPSTLLPETRVATPRRAVRGLLLGFVLSGLNLLGAFLTIAALGGLGAWSSWQFIGLFALFELGTGIAFIIGPNIWHLPIAQASTSERTDVRLAASTIFIPHWAAGAKAGAGLLLLVAAAVHEGVGIATLGMLPVTAAIVAVCHALSLLVARIGVARPDLDVLFIVVKRPGHDDHALPGISIGASVVQMLINIGAYPAVKLLPPTALYQPEIGPSLAVLLWVTAVAAVFSVAAWLAWRGRISWRAPREQQREAEEFA